MPRPAAGVLLLAAVAAAGYIHVPPPTLKKLAADSGSVRTLTVTKLDAEKRTAEFEVAEAIRAPKSGVKSFRFTVPAGAPGADAIVKNLAVGGTAVFFSTEGDSGENTVAFGYGFLDDLGFSADYNAKREMWTVLRAEPQMSECYFGPVKDLPGLVKSILDGKAVAVPTKKAEKVDARERARQVAAAMEKNRK